MRVLILGGDGYLGWPTAMDMAARGHDVWVIDNYLRRHMAADTDSEPLIPAPKLPDRAALFEAATGHKIRVTEGDAGDRETLARVFQEFVPEALIHYAEQPSAPYSMRDYDSARITLDNNLGVTFNAIWAILEHAPDCHLIKLGTMGEYGTPNIDIEEGWIDIEHKGRRDTFLFPRAAGSLYHTTKVLDTDLIWFYCRVYGLRATDLMQGPVYGLTLPEAGGDTRLMPHFHYDDIFGTALNRFLVQAVAGVPLTVYGKGGQTRGYLNLLDTLQCVNLAMETPVEPGRLRILNQFTETFSVNALAEQVRRVGGQMGLDVTVQNLPNPRKEAEEHYYNPAHSGLLDLGLQPHYLTDEVMAEMLSLVRDHADRIDTGRILPRVKWN
ncbi:UDP-sulfoquinovose synthase [Rhodothalassium salexigens DSM 2132]|uniref:UDP-sulfoquinovose synthase n=1 Tax=Rhodothalassium salexigens DSM 2132 TaxID=1188247 RepID=A0A4R2PII4_RHOSA|nr:NAD-dependent epimerase/dehydratase family protein [Rhodothalassium salexigens]MBB4211368.1 UDP-sulfoquinovose synthase [Rhodothalassium salexigens DSM 2132]MBK1637702.1 NAD-dependent dehydratase [Rhodothalassium salexigens DSM 2132]TCP35289.1 UDP-sulfoquinovose synthase [Rhodothalassium salexigens DSM 2132]